MKAFSKEPVAVVLSVFLLVGLFAAGMPDTADARVVLQSRGPRHLMAPAHQEFVIEGGLAEPAGDQKDGFFTSDNGFDATTGYQLGVRYRYYLGDGLSVAPAVHYTRFGEAQGVGEFVNPGELLGYNLLTSNLRYGLDFQVFLGDPAMRLRPYVTGGVALIHNRYRDELQYEGVFETSMNTPGFSAGFGLKMDALELCCEYTVNRFSTANLTPDLGKLDYNWDYLVVRVGLALGR